MSQLQLARLSHSVSTAYQAYSACPVYFENPATQEAINIIRGLQPNTYANIAPIFVFESNPNSPGYPDDTSKDPENADPAKPPMRPLDGDDADFYTPGYQLFGFAATHIPMGVNVLIIRGTVTPEEAGASLWNWDATAPCVLPTGKSITKTYGNVKDGYWSFYADKGFLSEASLATSLKNAIQSVKATSPYSIWQASAHSLGGAMLCLGLLDAMTDGILNKPSLVATFGSVVVGDVAWAVSYNTTVGDTIRIANLCDFVPSLRSLLPGPVTVKYTHVGESALFVWQTDNDWDNHSLDNVYMPMVINPANFSLIFVGMVKYPVSIAAKMVAHHTADVHCETKGE